MTTVNRPQSASSNRCKMIGLIAGGVLAATAGLAAGGETTAGSIKELSASNGSATAAEDFAAKVEVLGAAIAYGSYYDANVTARVVVGGDVLEPFGPFGSSNGGNVNDGSSHSVVLPSMYSAGEEVQIEARSWVKHSTSHSGNSDSHWYSFLNVSASGNSDNVIALRNGDDVPSIAPLNNQASINSFLSDHIDTNTGKISIQPHQVIYLFELGTTNMSSSAADFQDLVVLVSFARDVNYFVATDEDAPSRSVVAAAPSGQYD